MKFKIILFMVLTLIMLAGCQDNKPNNAIEGRDLKEVTIYEYEGSSGKTEDKTLLTTLGEQEVQEFENIVQNVTRVKEEDLSVAINHSIDITYAEKYHNNDKGGMGLELGNQDEKSYITHGKDSYSKLRIYEVSADQTSKLRKMIKNNSETFSLCTLDISKQNPAFLVHVPRCFTEVKR